MLKNKVPQNKVTVFTLLTIAVVLFAVCSKKPDTAITVESNGQQVYQIKTWSKLDCTGAPYFVGEKKGFFREEGVEIIYTGDTEVPIRVASILNGDNNVGDAHPNEIAIAREGGATIRAVALSIIEPPPGIDDPHLQHMWWITAKNSPIKKPEDINAFPGRVKIQMIVRNACMDFNTDVLLQRYNIPREKFEYITMPDIEGIQALSQGLIDIAIPHPPFFKSAEDLGANIIATSRELRGEHAGTYLYYFADSFIEKNPEAVRRFVRAIKKAERWANDNPEQTAKWTEEAIGIPVLANHYYARISAIDDAGIEIWIQGAKDAGSLEPDAKVKVSDIVTHQFDDAGGEI
jgi:ABC-type nitrate/sulfonate/bicarbonate transport system substrate-binding protein